MNVLLNVLLFGVAGAVLMAALIGLMLVSAGREGGAGRRVVFGALSVAVFVALPTAAALGQLGTDPRAGLVFSAAFGAVLVAYAANLAFLPLAARQVASAHPEAPVARLRIAPAAAALGLLACALLGGLGTGLATAIA